MNTDVVDTAGPSWDRPRDAFAARLALLINYDVIVSVTGQPVRWAAPRGSVV
jgi:hypothetical protein